jgi:hypothetical protein
VTQLREPTAEAALFAETDAGKPLSTAEGVANANDGYGFLALMSDAQPIQPIRVASVQSMRA